MTFVNSTQYKLLFLFEHREIVSKYLNILSQLFIKAQKIDSFKLLNEIFISNEVWNNVVKYFAKGVFSQMRDLSEQHNKSPSKAFTLDQIRLYHISRSIVNHYISVMIFCRRIILQEKLDQVSSSSSQNLKGQKAKNHESRQK